MTTDEKHQEILCFATRFYPEAPDWVTFYRETFGLHGIVRRHFPTPTLLAEFEQSETYRELQQMLTRLREQGPLTTDPQEPTRVITVRLPRSLHESLRVEAHEHHTSMNKLCISKLLQFIEEGMVPAETWATRPEPARSPATASNAATAPEEESSE
ncbi:MAG: toxin-antitoxin system HicB family antitoxin [Pirellulales bacterium]|nr:toxin-antitoxin system HicB family antitoxin [Pirellulales bacterium]